MQAPAGSIWKDQYEKVPPWDIGKAQPELVKSVAGGEIQGPTVLDVGSGTGDNALYLASAGFHVSAFDLIDKAVEITKERIAQAGPLTGSIQVHQANVFELAQSALAGRQFDTIIDSAMFHCIGDDAAQARYVAAITPYTRKGGRLFLHVFSDDNPDPWIGPRRISEAHIRRFFGEEAGWRLLSLRRGHFVDGLERPATGGVGGRSIVAIAERI